MGRITEKVNKFLLRLANRLGIKKDNLLESAKGKLKQMGPVINNAVPGDEGIKEEILSDHEKFIQQVKEDAKKFDPSMMSKEETIMKILEQQGLNPEFSKNPEAVSRITKLSNNRLKSNGIDNINSSNLEYVKSILIGKNYPQSTLGRPIEKIETNIFIDKDGNLEYSESYNECDEEHNDIQTFMIDDRRELEVIQYYDTKQKSLLKDNPYEYNAVSKHEQIYNKNGLEVKHTYDFCSLDTDLKSNKVERNDSSWEITRNDDLVTAYVVRHTDAKVAFGTKSFLSKDKSRSFENRYNDNPVGEMIYCTKLRGRGQDLGMNVPSLEELESSDGKTIENGYVKFGEESKQEHEKYSNKLIQKEARESLAFRKTAEERGLIEKEEELEQE